MEPLQLKKILFPVDFSPRSDGAAHFAEAVAGRFQAELTLLHVVEKTGMVYGMPEFFDAGTYRQLQEAQSRAASEKLDSYLKADLKHFDVRRALVEGEPGRKIVEYAHAHQTDLIMMPSHGFGPFRRYILGSVTAKVLHDAHCPVWTGAHLENAPPLEKISFERVLCAVDLSPLAEKALAWAAAWAQEYSAEMTVVHGVIPAMAVAGGYIDPQITLSQMEHARQQLTQMLARLGVAAKVCVEEGEPARVVAGAAARLGAPLVVIARGSAAEGFGRLKTNAYSVIRHSPCPVVSV